MISLDISGVDITLFPGVSAGSPIVYLNCFAGEGYEVLKALHNIGNFDLTLAAISGLDWGRDMSPWPAPPIRKGSPDFAGGGDKYLGIFIESLIPAVESSLPSPPGWRGIAGYSMAGLFAVYSLFKTGAFTRAASVSGSLWYPGFLEYAASHEPAAVTERVYFSLGDREHKTRNASMRPVRENTEKIERLFHGRVPETTFRLEPGGHFDAPAERTARGIAWLIG